MDSSNINLAFSKAQADIKGRLDGNFQREGVKWMLQRELHPGMDKGGILADDMGLGKTMQTIALLRGNPLPTLIVTIVGPTVCQWRDALVDFGGYQPVIINPSFGGMLPQGIEVAVTTYSAFQKASPPICLSKYPWGRVVLDEGHVIRNPKTKVFTELSKVKATHKWVLTGTPIQNSEKDLFTLAEWIRADMRSNEYTLENIVSKYVLRRTQEEQGRINPRLALPALETRVIKLPFKTTEEKEFYDSVEMYYHDKANTAVEAMEALTRCRQACTNPRIYGEAVGGGNKKTKKRSRNSNMPLPSDGLSSTKLDFLVQDMSTNVKNGHKCLVFCIWTNEMKFLQEALDKAGVASLIYDGQLSRDNKDAVIYNFKHTNIPILILQINCGAAGLNLQCATKVYITSPNWNPCTELQAIGRAYRKGQLSQVACTRVIMEGTVEERCMEIQDTKMKVIKEAMSDDSLANRLGCLKNCDDDINIVKIFKGATEAKKTKVEVERKDSFDLYLDTLLNSQ